MTAAAGGPGHGDHLEFIRRAGRTTRKAIAEHTGLSRSVVAQGVAELIAQGIVVERRVDPPPTDAPGALRARRGRPTSVLELAPQRGVVVAADIGHRHLTVATCDLHGGVLAERRIPFPVDEGSAPTFRRVHAMTAESLREAGAVAAEVKAFGVSLPFPVMKATGTVRAPAALAGWQHAEAARARPPGISGPLVADNDANFGAWGERVHRHRAHPARADGALDNLLYVKLGHGIGAGLVVDGMLLSGARGTGGEMGHIQVVPGGALCRCGRRGCLETVVAESLPDHRLAGLRVGRAIAQLCAFIDAETVILGGTFGGSAALVDGVREAFERYLPGGEAADGGGTAGPDAGASRVDVRAAVLGERSELVGIIDRALSAAWASGDIRPATTALSSFRRTNSRAVLDVPFESERFVMKE
ncbi:ROK family transcriptional regulator [Herbiconiux sp. P18]|uniref:ROK family transcriptional regulator n=1 Tax=Herbiconiux liangxiaofengii TaxID=3342795 RepID=UPI0035B9587C